MPRKRNNRRKKPLAKGLSKSKRASARRQKLVFGDALVVSLPTPPTSINYSKAVATKDWGWMGNQFSEDCTCAAAGHMIQTWTANQGKELILQDSDITYAFTEISTDGDGADLPTALQYWKNTGIGRHTITDYAGFALKNHDALKSCIFSLGGAYLGLALPAFAKSLGQSASDSVNIPWTVPAGGATGVNQPLQSNGHCVAALGYDDQFIYFVTWGQVKTMTWDFYDAYVDEAFAVLSPDWINPSTQLAPNGANVSQLQAEIDQMKGEQPVPVTTLAVAGGAPFPPKAAIVEVWEKILLYCVLGAFLIAMFVFLGNELSTQEQNYSKGMSLVQQTYSSVMSKPNSSAYRPDVSLLYAFQFTRALEAAHIKTASLILGTLIVCLGCVVVVYGVEASYQLTIQPNTPSPSTLTTSSPGLVLITLGVAVIIVAQFTHSSFNTAVDWGDPSTNAPAGATPDQSVVHEPENKTYPVPTKL